MAENLPKKRFDPHAWGDFTSNSPSSNSADVDILGSVNSPQLAHLEEAVGLQHSGKSEVNNSQDYSRRFPPSENSSSVDSLFESVVKNSPRLNTLSLVGSGTDKELLIKTLSAEFETYLMQKTNLLNQQPPQQSDKNSEGVSEDYQSVSDTLQQERSPGSGSLISSQKPASNESVTSSFDDSHRSSSSGYNYPQGKNGKNDDTSLHGGGVDSIYGQQIDNKNLTHRYSLDSQPVDMSSLHLSMDTKHKQHNPDKFILPGGYEQPEKSPPISSYSDKHTGLHQPINDKFYSYQRQHSQNLQPPHVAQTPNSATHSSPPQRQDSYVPQTSTERDPYDFSSSGNIESEPGHRSAYTSQSHPVSSEKRSEYTSQSHPVSSEHSTAVYRSVNYSTTHQYTGEINTKESNTTHVHPASSNTHNPSSSIRSSSSSSSNFGLDSWYPSNPSGSDEVVRSHATQSDTVSQCSSPSFYRQSSVENNQGSSPGSNTVSSSNPDLVMNIKHEMKMDYSVTSSGRNRGLGKANEPRYNCQVCGDVAAGFHCGAYVCEACKKFYLRCLKNGGSVAYSCPKNQQCTITKETRSHCQFCRFQKCLELSMYKPGRDDGKHFKVDFKSIPCKVCSAPSSGFHFGAITCEGCKGFFRRMVKENLHRKFICTSGQKCDVTSSNRTACKACRYQKCLQVGMALEGTRLGRQSNSIKRSTLINYETQGIKAGSNETGEKIIHNVQVKTEPVDVDNYSPGGGSKTDDSYQRSTSHDYDMQEGYSERYPGEQLDKQNKDIDLGRPASSDTAHVYRQHSGNQVYLNENTLMAMKKRLGGFPEDNIDYTMPKRVAYMPESESAKPQHRMTLEDVTPNRTLPEEDSLAPIILQAYQELKKITIRPPEMDNYVIKDETSPAEHWAFASMSFMHHAKCTLKFVKKLPGFMGFSMNDQITMVRECVYPIALLIHSQSYDLETGEYSFFINTKEELDKVFKFFPQFKGLNYHFQYTGHTLKSMNLSEAEYAFLCAISVFAADTFLMEAKTKIRTLQEAMADAFMKYSLEIPGGDSGRLGNLLLRLAELKRANLEHTQLAIDVQKENPDINFSELWNEMFLEPQPGLSPPDDGMQVG